MKSRNNIILIGYRGTGKTTVARLLAERLGWEWVDADACLETKYGQTIRDIFQQEGEAGFRDKESAVLADLCERDKQVLATGGGVILRPENRLKLRQAGRVVWLTADAATIWARLQEDVTTAERRPALTPLAGLNEIRQLLAVREPLYRECADLIVDTGSRSSEEVTRFILEQLTLS